MRSQMVTFNSVPYVRQFLTFQGKYAEAEPLYERCQAILEKGVGTEHPSVATTLNNPAGFLSDLVRAGSLRLLEEHVPPLFSISF